MDIVLNTAFNNPKLPVVRVDYFTDNFDRPDASTLGVTPVGALPWQLAASGAGVPVGSIVGGKAQVAASSSSTSRFAAVVDTGRTDGVLRATFAATPVLNGGNLTLRFIDINNYLFVVPVDNSGSLVWGLYSRVAGTGNVLVRSSVPAAMGDRLEVTLKGPQVTVVVNEGLSFSTSITDHAAGTKFGFANAGNLVPTPLWDGVSFSNR